MLRANVDPELLAYATGAATKRISSTTALATNVAKNMATSRQIVSNHDLKHAAGQTRCRTERSELCMP
jgi:hypothetical protein